MFLSILLDIALVQLPFPRVDVARERSRISRILKRRARASPSATRARVCLIASEHFIYLFIRFDKSDRALSLRKKKGRWESAAVIDSVAKSFSEALIRESSAMSGSRAPRCETFFASMSYDITVERGERERERSMFYLRASYIQYIVYVCTRVCVHAAAIMHEVSCHRAHIRIDRVRR